MKNKVLTKEEAEKEGRQQVKQQNEITRAQNYKFVKVGDLDECWVDARKTKYYNLHGQLLVWRLDGSEFASDMWDGDEGHWTKTPFIFIKKNGHYWYVLADYAENSPIWKDFLATVSPLQKQWTLERYRIYNKYRKK